MVDTVIRAGIVVDSQGAKRGTDQVNDSLKRTENRVARLSRRFKRFGDTTQAVFNRLSKARSAILSVRGAFAGLGVALSLGAVVREIDAFTFELSKLSAITGAVGEDLEFLEQRALELGRTTIFSGQQALEGFALMASAKPDLLENAAALAETTEQALTLAAAAGTDLPNAANILGASLNQFRTGAEDANRFINVLAAGSKFGASFILDTAAALKQAGTAANLAKISFEETNAAVQVLATSNIKGAEAGTNLRNIIVRLQTQADQFNPKIVGLQKAFENLGDANLSVAEKVKIFGVENLNAADILIQGTGALGEFTEKLTGTNVAAEQAATNYDNLRGDILALQSAWSGFLIDIGQENESFFRTAVQGLTSFVNSLTANLRIVEAKFRIFANTMAMIWEEIKFTFNVVATVIEKGWETMLNGMRGALATFIESSADKLEVLTLGFADETVDAMRKTASGLRMGAEGATTLEEEIRKLKDQHDGWIKILRRDNVEQAEKIRLAEISKRKTKELADATRDLTTSGGGVGAPPPGADDAVTLTKEQTKALKSLRDELDPVGAAVRKYEEQLKLLNEARRAGVLTAEEYATAEMKVLEAQKEEILETTGVTEAIKKLNEARKEARSLAQDQDVRVGFQAEIDSINELQETLRGLGGEEDVALAERLERNKAALQEQIRTFGDYAASVDPVMAAEKQRAEEMAKLNVLIENGVISQGAYNERMRELEAAVRDAALATGQLTVEQQAFEGMKAGVMEYGKTATDVFGQVKQATTDAFQRAEDALVDFVETGKLDFSSLVDSILADIQRMAVRQMVGQLAQSFSSAFAQAGSQTGAQPAAGGTTGTAGGGGFGGMLGSLFSSWMASGANGLDFRVGGAGGTDSQMVAFRSTPGARVVEMPPGQADGMGRSVNIQMHLHGVKDERTFARNQSQVVNNLQREMENAGRNM